jgi:flagellar basal-body rod modification protein FlgD
MTSPVTGVLATASTPAITQTTATSQTAQTQTAATKTDQGLLDPQAFLRLLVAQLQYQDPTNPVDTSTFMNQTAMLSQVQTMNAMSQTLTALVSDQQTQAATSLIGKNVTYTDSGGIPQTGLVSSVSLGAAGAMLHVGDAAVPLSSVVEVSAPSTPAPSTPAPSTP